MTALRMEMSHDALEQARRAAEKISTRVTAVGVSDDLGDFIRRVDRGVTEIERLRGQPETLNVLLFATTTEMDFAKAEAIVANDVLRRLNAQWDAYEANSGMPTSEFVQDLSATTALMRAVKPLFAQMGRATDETLKKRAHEVRDSLDDLYVAYVTVGLARLEAMIHELEQSGRKRRSEAAIAEDLLALDGVLSPALKDLSEGPQAASLAPVLHPARELMGEMRKAATEIQNAAAYSAMNQLLSVLRDQERRGKIARVPD
jgi:hypothetical protein